MPSPVGHALAGYAVGVLVARPGRPGGAVSATPLGRFLVFAGLACMPDLDLLFGAHSMYTHSVGAVFVVAVGAALAFPGSWSLIVACTLAYASHPFLDWLGRDSSPPLGIMALWPFSHEYFMSPHPIITPVTRRYWLPEFWSHNIRVVSLEVLLFGSLAAATHWLRLPTRRSRAER